MISLLPDTGSLGATLSAHPVAALAAVYAGGVVTGLTPCELPRLPVTVSNVGGSAGARGRPRRR
jgi:cytochrome c biogenesis protein CcdA